MVLCDKMKDHNIIHLILINLCNSSYDLFAKVHNIYKMYSSQNFILMFCSLAPPQWIKSKYAFILCDYSKAHNLLKHSIKT